MRICPEKLPELLLCRSTAPVGIGISRPCVAAVLWAASAGCNRARAKAGEALGGFYPPRGKPTRRETHPGTAGAGPWSSRRHRSAARAPPCWGGNAKFLQQRTLNNSFQEEPWVFLRRYHPRRAGRRVTQGGPGCGRHFGGDFHDYGRGSWKGRLWFCSSALLLVLVAQKPPSRGIPWCFIRALLRSWLCELLKRLRAALSRRWGSAPLPSSPGWLKPSHALLVGFGRNLGTPVRLAERFSPQHCPRRSPSLSLTKPESQF